MPRAPAGVETVGGAAEQLLDRHRAIACLRDEGRVRAVFKEPPHEISKEIAMPADRGVDAAADAFLCGHGIEERLAHAIEALELEVPGGAGHFKDRRDGKRVV